MKFPPSSACAEKLDQAGSVSKAAFWLLPELPARALAAVLGKLFGAIHIWAPDVARLSLPGWAPQQVL